jgi:Domain of Unknown Function (DUF1080)
MKKLPILSVLFSGLLLAIPIVRAADAPLLPLLSDPPVNAEILWNGRDIAGWTIFLKDPSVDPKSVWSVDAGTLRLTGKPFGYLRSVKTYSNYYLHAEWRYPADAPATANSGVFIHVHGQDNIWPSGIECQLKAGETGQLIATNIDIPSAPLIRGKKRANPTGPHAEKPFGEWNSYDIFCRGDSVDVYVNGVLENHVEKITISSGSIALQLEGTVIQFRKVWLEPL